MSDIEKLNSLCKAGLSISINDHRTVYMTALQCLMEMVDRGEEIDRGIIEKCDELDTIVEIWAYSKTPVGHFKIIHYDIDQAIDEAIKACEDEK